MEIAPGTHWIGGWVGPRVGLDAMKRQIFDCQEANPGRPARRYTDWAIPALLDDPTYYTNDVAHIHVRFLTSPKHWRCDMYLYCCFVTILNSILVALFTSTIFWHCDMPRGSRVNSVSIVNMTDRGLDSRQGQEIFLFSTVFKTGSGAHPACYPVSTGGYFRRGKAAVTWSCPLTSILCRG
jgi:hypothetical protein